MNKAEITLRSPSEYTQLSTFDRRILDVMHVSRAAQEEQAKWYARSAMAIYEREDISATYESLASAEAKALGKQMLRLDRQRLLPIRKPVRLSRERDWNERAYRGNKTHEVTTPLMFGHDAVNVVDLDVSEFPVNLTTGWRFTTITEGNDLRHVLACVSTPNPDGSPARRAVNLIADHVAAERDTRTEKIIESTVYNLYGSGVSVYPEIANADSDSEHFVIQTGLLRAARLACGEGIN